MAIKLFRMLILDDSEDEALLLVRELSQQGFDVKWERAWTAGDMKSRLQTGTWDVVLPDYSMPAFQCGQKPLKVCSERLNPDLPVHRPNRGTHLTKNVPPPKPIKGPGAPTKYPG